VADADGVAELVAEQLLGSDRVPIEEAVTTVVDEYLRLDDLVVSDAVVPSDLARLDNERQRWAYRKLRRCRTRTTFRFFRPSCWSAACTVPQPTRVEEAVCARVLERDEEDDEPLSFAEDRTAAAGTAARKKPRSKKAGNEPARF
jgi:hypothetical protein